MVGIDPLLVGLVLLIVGVGVFLLARLLAEWAARRKPTVADSGLPPALQLDLEPAINAVIIAHSGGRVSFVNEQARQWFQTNGVEPDLDQLAQMARPTDLFLELCAAEGQARLSVGEHSVEAASYQVPLDEGSGMVVVMKPVRVDGEDSRQSSLDDFALQAIAGFGRQASANPSLPETINAVLHAAQELFVSDIHEINVWEETTQTLKPYRLGTSRSSEFETATDGEVYQVGEGYTGWLTRHRRSLYIPDVDKRPELQPKGGRSRFPFNAYMGIPLIIGDLLIGTLEMANFQPNTYDSSDRTLLEFVGPQAATSLHNAILFEQQERRADELAGLSDLAQAVSALTDSEELFGRLSQGIAKLMDVEILGFLLYDEVSEHLMGQIPFSGIPDPFVDRYYQISAPPDSAASALLQSHSHWLSNNVPADPEVDAMGMRALAQAASLKSTLIIPISSGGRQWGVIQAANKINGQPFDEEDIRLLSILAGQSSALIENAKLVEDSRGRAARAEGLRRMTALAASTATLDELLIYALNELSQLLDTDLAAFLLVDEDQGELRPHSPSLRGFEDEEASQTLTISIDDPEFKQSVTKTQQSILSNQAADQARQMASLRTLVSQFDVESVLNIPLVVQDIGMGEILLAKNHGDGFTTTDLDLVTTFAGQIAGALEKARLSAQTDIDLRQRVDQLNKISRVGREFSGSLEPGELTTIIHDQSLQATGMQYGRVILLKDASLSPKSAVELVAGRGDSELSGIERDSLELARPVLITGKNKISNPLSKKVSVAVLGPLSYQGELLGLIHLQSEDEEDGTEALEVMGGLAVQAAVAIRNARRYQNQIHRAELLRRRAEALSQIFYISKSLRTVQELEVNLETIVFGLQAASGFNHVAIHRIEPSDARFVPGASTEHLGQNATEARTFENAAVIDELMQNAVPFSQSYLATSGNSKTKLTGEETQPSQEQIGQRLRAWQPGDRLYVPLKDFNGKLIGLMTLSSPRPGINPDPETIETIELFANQAALSIENTMLSTKAESNVDSLQRQLQDLRIANDELSQSSRHLLRQLTDNSEELELYRRRTDRIQSLARVIEVAGSQVDDASILRTFAQMVLRELHLNLVLIAEVGDAGFSITHTAGDLAEEINIDALMGQRNPLRSAYQQDKAILVTDVAASHEWVASPLLKETGATSALALPVNVDGEVGAVALLIENQGFLLFDQEDLDLYSTFANQLGAALEHIRLLRSVEQRLAEGNLLLEFSRQLGSLELDVVLNSLADGLRRAMPATEASLVALYRAESGTLLPYGHSGFVDTYALESIAYQPGESLPGKVYESGDETHWREINFTSDINLQTENLQRYTQASDGRVPVSALGMPLKIGDSVLGVIILENYTTANAFSETDATFVRSLARQASLTIQNARLYQSTEERARQLEALANVSATLTSSLDTQQIVQSMLLEFGLVLPYNSATLWLREGEALTVVAAQGFADNEERLGVKARLDDSSLYEEMVGEMKPILVHDTTNDSRFPSFPEYPVRSWLGIPLVSRDQVIGLLSLDNYQTNGYHDRHIEIATTLARQAAVALENAQLYEQTRQSSQELELRVAERTEDLAREHERSEALLRITSELSTSLDLDRVLRRALMLVNDVIGADRGVILLVAPESDELILRASLGGSDELPPGGVPSPFIKGEGLAGWIIDNREPVIIPDLTHDERWVPHHDRIEEHKSALAVPLLVSDDALGALLLFSHRRNAFLNDQLVLVAAAANQVAAAINNAELYRLIRDQAERLGTMLREQQVEASKSRAILESVADGVLVTNAAHEIILFNPAAERILRLDSETVLNKPAVDYIGVYGRAGQRWGEAVQDWSRNPPVSEKGEVDELFDERLSLEGDRVVSVHLSPAVLGEEFLGTVSVFRDITRDVEVDRLKSEFVATVSHELRTPMTSIKGYVEVLLMGAGGELSDEQKRFLNIVKVNTDRLGILVNDLLDVSRIEAGKIDLAALPIDAGELLEDGATFVRQRSEEESKPIEIIIEIPDNLPSVEGDPDRVRQVVYNLVDNSFNYTPSGGRITLSAEPEGKYVVFKIADNGIGIPPSEHERVFERFFRGEQALNMAVSGTGLGLAIVQQLVEMHSGRIWVASEGIPGEGSAFIFTLPIRESAEKIMEVQD